LNDPKFDEDYNTVAGSLKENGLRFIICNSEDIKTSEKAIEIASAYNEIFAAIGFHPHNAKDFKDEYAEFFKTNSKNPKVVAIGEIGLDYYYDLSPRDIQKEVLKKQLKIAHEAELPVIFHLRDAKEDFLKILEENRHLLTNGGVVHSFSDDIETAKRIMALGLFIGINGTVTFKNFKRDDVIAALPLDRILLETDSPYLSPEPYRGHRNEPKNVRLVAEAIARIKNIAACEVIEQTGKNVLAVFFKMKGAK
jgi:TatD DNase family protein